MPVESILVTDEDEREVVLQIPVESILVTDEDERLQTRTRELYHEQSSGNTVGIKFSGICQGVNISFLLHFSVFNKGNNML